MAAAAKTRPSLEPAPSCRGRGVALRAVQRDEDHPRDHCALQTAIYINALIMVLRDIKKHESRRLSSSSTARLDGWLPEN